MANGVVFSFSKNCSLGFSFPYNNLITFFHFIKIRILKLNAVEILIRMMKGINCFASDM